MVEGVPEFAKAAVAFRARGDLTELDYGEPGIIRATIRRLNLARTSSRREHRWKSDPLVKSDRDLRIFRLAINSEIDGEMAPQPCEKTGRRSPDSHTTLLPPPGVSGSAELAIAVIYEGDLQTVTKT